MANYRVEVSATAERQIRRLRIADRLRVVRAIRELGRDPHPRGQRKVRGYENVWRIRVGTYRILYRVEGGKLLIIILKIGHRRDIYR